MRSLRLLGLATVGLVLALLLAATFFNLFSWGLWSIAYGWGIGPWVIALGGLAFALCGVAALACRVAAPASALCGRGMMNCDPAWHDSRQAPPPQNLS